MSILISFGSSHCSLLIVCYKWRCLDQSWSLSEMPSWDFWGAIQGMGRVKSLPEVQSFSFFPNSTQSHVAAASQLLVRKAQEWDKRAAKRSWRSQNLWIQFLPTLLRQININERKVHLQTHTEARATRGREHGRGLHCQKGALSATGLQKSTFLIVAVEKQGPAWCATCGQGLWSLLKTLIFLKLSRVWFPLSNPYFPSAICSSKITFFLKWKRNLCREPSLTLA